MAREVFKVREDRPLVEIVQTMVEKRVKQPMATDAEGRLGGWEWWVDTERIPGGCHAGFHLAYAGSGLSIARDVRSDEEKKKSYPDSQLLCTVDRR
jgi:hypothetical protein